MRIDMFVYNHCTNDSRVLKEAATLSSAGHRVRIVAVLDDTTSPAEERNGFQILRIDRNPIHYRLLKAMRKLTELVRHGATETISRANRGARGRRRPAAFLVAPVVLAARLARLLLRAGFSALRRFEAAVRRLLLAPHKPLMFFDYYRRAYQVVRADPPDAVHAHDLNTLPVAAALAWRLRLRLIYDSHELYPEISTLSPREAAVWRRLEHLLARRATRVLTVCESIADEIEQRNGVERPLVLLNCPLAGAIAEPAALHELVGLSLDEPIVLYQGGFAPYRGLRTAVLASQRLTRGTLVLMGWGRLEGELRALIKEEGLEERVLITGPVPPEQVVAHAAAATVGLIPYEPVGLNNTYTTPNKLFDYMAAGLPIVASSLPELVRFVDGNEIGATVQPADPEALAIAIDGILSDEKGRLEMRGRALEAGGRFTWEHESEKLLDLYASP